MNGHTDTAAPDGGAPGRATVTPAQRLKRKLINGALGMGAEILFACGLMLAGFAISLLSGW